MAPHDGSLVDVVSLPAVDQHAAGQVHRGRVRQELSPASWGCVLLTDPTEGSTMGVMAAMPRTGEEWTVDDLDLLPDDGLQYELLDGLLLVTSAPVVQHQRVIGNLYVVLRAACPAGFEVLFAPVDWRPDRRTSLQPDLVVIRNEDAGVQSYWIVDPTEPSVLAFDLEDGVYANAADVRGAERATLRSPFPLDIVPADSVRPAL